MHRLSASYLLALDSRAAVNTAQQSGGVVTPAVTAIPALPEAAPSEVLLAPPYRSNGIVIDAQQIEFMGVQLSVVK